MFQTDKNATAPVSTCIEQEPKNTRSRILGAARIAFAQFGFEGTSLRHIADRAGETHQLLVYHFGTKEGVWRASIEELLSEGLNTASSLRKLSERDAEQALRQYVHLLIQFSARFPEFHRIMTFEGQADSPRFRWLVEKYLKVVFETSIHLITTAQNAGVIRSCDASLLHYGLIGLVTSRFVFALESRMLSGIDPFQAKEVSELEALALALLGLPDS